VVKKLILFTFLAVLMGTLGAGLVLAGPPGPKNPPDGHSLVTICHKPGTPAQKTMNVPDSAVAGHLGHGDILGSCGGRIVANHDEWTLSDVGFSNQPTNAAKFALNIADWFTEIDGEDSGNFLVYSSNFGLVQTQLANTMTGAGHTWTINAGFAPFTAENLDQFDGVFVALNPAADTGVLIEYVENGGNVYVAAGTGRGGSVAEAAHWNGLLNPAGLDYAPPPGSGYNGVVGNIAVSSSHPILQGVTALFYINGNSVSELDPADPDTDILTSSGSHGLIGVAIVDDP